MEPKIYYSVHKTSDMADCLYVKIRNRNCLNTNRSKPTSLLRSIEGDVERDDEKEQMEMIGGGEREREGKEELKV
jgi:hypothetical protein